MTNSTTTTLAGPNVNMQIEATVALEPPTVDSVPFAEAAPEMPDRHQSAIDRGVTVLKGLLAKTLEDVGDELGIQLAVGTAIIGATVVAAGMPFWKTEDNGRMDGRPRGTKEELGSEHLSPEVARDRERYGDYHPANDGFKLEKSKRGLKRQLEQVKAAEKENRAVQNDSSQSRGARSSAHDTGQKLARIRGFIEDTLQGFEN